MISDCKLTFLLWQKTTNVAKENQRTSQQKKKNQLTFPDLPSQNIHNWGTYSPEKQITCNYKKNFEKKRMSSRSIHSFVSKFCFPGCIYMYIYVIYSLFSYVFCKGLLPKNVGKTHCFATLKNHNRWMSFNLNHPNPHLPGPLGLAVARPNSNRKAPRLKHKRPPLEGPLLPGMGPWRRPPFVCW